MSVGYSRFFFIFLVLRIHLEILDEGLVIAVVDDYCNCLKNVILIGFSVVF